MMNNIDLIYEAYKNYQWNQPKSFPAEPDSNLTQEEFVNKIKTDEVFSKRWGITIETKELNLEERRDVYKKDKSRLTYRDEDFTIPFLNMYDIPTKLTIINYNGQI